MHPRKGDKLIATLTHFHLIHFTCSWGDGVVDLLLGLPFLIFKSKNQNLLYHSPLNFTALPTSGRRYFIFNLLDMHPRKGDKLIAALIDFHLIHFTCSWGDGVVNLVVNLPFVIYNCGDQNLLYHSPLNFTALPTSGRLYFILNLLDMHRGKGDKLIAALTHFHLIHFTCSWGDGVVDLLLGLPFLIFKSENQNLFYHSPLNFTALPTSGRRYFIFNLLDMHPRKGDKLIAALTHFHLIHLTCMWGDGVVDIVVGLPFLIYNCADQNLLYHSSLNFTALPTSGRRYFSNLLDMHPSKGDKLIAALTHFHWIHLTCMWGDGVVDLVVGLPFLIFNCEDQNLLYHLISQDSPRLEGEFLF